MKTDCKELHQQEREKLDQMIEDALILGIKIAEDKKIQKQSHLVERLIEGAENTQKRRLG